MRTCTAVLIGMGLALCVAAPARAQTPPSQANREAVERWHAQVAASQNRREEAERLAEYKGRIERDGRTLRLIPRRGPVVTFVDERECDGDCGPNAPYANTSHLLLRVIEWRFALIGTDYDIISGDGQYTVSLVDLESGQTPDISTAPNFHPNGQFALHLSSWRLPPFFYNGFQILAVGTDGLSVVSTGKWPRSVVDVEFETWLDERTARLKLTLNLPGCPLISREATGFITRTGGIDSWELQIPKPPQCP